MAEAPNLMAVHPSMPVNTVKDMIALAKSKPGRLAGMGFDADFD